MPTRPGGSTPHEDPHGFLYKNKLRPRASTVSNKAVSSNRPLRQRPTTDQQMDDLTEVPAEGELVENVGNGTVYALEEDEDLELVHGVGHRQQQHLHGDLVSPAEPAVPNNTTDPNRSARTEFKEIDCHSKKRRSTGCDSVTEDATLNVEIIKAVSHLSVFHGIDTVQRSPLTLALQGRSPDATYIHPSLRMTTQEFSEAKMIVLDLLGWGVPSEYLLQYGLTREFIYYAFTGLNLRLPKDFNTDGITPFEVPPDASMTL